MKIMLKNFNFLLKNLTRQNSENHFLNKKTKIFLRYIKRFQFGALKNILNRVETKERKVGHDEVFY